MFLAFKCASFCCDFFFFFPLIASEKETVQECFNLMLIYFGEIKMRWELGIRKILQVYIWTLILGTLQVFHSLKEGKSETLNKHLTWRSVSFTRQQCANVAVLAGHDCDLHPSLVRHMKQDAAVLPSKSCADPGIVDVDLHRCLAQLLTSQRVIDLHL